MGHCPLPDTATYRVVINLGATEIDSKDDLSALSSPPFTRIFVQATQEAVATISKPKCDNLELMSYDSFTPQPVIG